MLKHYLKIFFHNLFRQKVITLINIAGLSIGMAVFILVSLYVKEEYSHDAHWANSDRIVRTTLSLNFNSNTSFEIEGGPLHALRQLQEFFPNDISVGTRVYRGGQSIIINEEEISKSLNFVDPEFLDIFDLEEVSGNLLATLATPGQIALEEEEANTLFTGSALGQTLILKMPDGSEQDFEVSAIYRTPAGKGRLDFTNLTLLSQDILLGNETDENDWLSGIDVNNYLLLAEADSAQKINARTEEFVEQYVRIPWRDPETPIAVSFGFSVQPIRDMYFEPLRAEEGGSRLITNSFALVAALVLLIAITNFVILSVARSAERVREVGVRKANGALSLQLQGQFLLESLLQVVLAFVIALALYEVLKPVFENIMQVTLYTQLFSAQYSLLGVALIIVVSLLGGTYPAFVLASTNPEQALKTAGSISMGSMLLRKTLVCFQFTIAIGLIVSTLVIFKQLSFVQSRDPGFDANQVVSVGLFSEQARKSGTALINEIENIDGVDMGTPASRTANSLTGTIQITTLSKERGSDEVAELYAYGVGYNFFSLYSMDVLAGRTFSQEHDPLIDRSNFTDEQNNAFITKVVLNESAIRDFGLSSPEEAVGTALYAEFRTQEGKTMISQHEIIGVVADSQFDSLRTAPNSEMFRLGGNWLLSFRVAEDEMDNVRSQIEVVWKKVIGIGNPVILFGRDIIAEEFSKEENEGLLLSGFALLAILVSCMGLYGLVAFDTAKRTKEIGVRKVLGGRQANIQYLFARQYFWPMIVANVIAWPMGIWAVQQWLEKFPYQVGQWVFIPICIIAGMVVITIAGSTLSATVARAFKAKPAQALRYE